MRTDAARRLWLKIQKRVGIMTPQMNRAMLESFDNVLKEMTDAQIRAALKTPDLFAEALLSDEKFARAFGPLRREIQRQVGDAVQWWTPELPNGGRINGVVSIGFNVLDPRIIEAVRQLDSKVMNPLQDSMRETMRTTFRDMVREGIENQHTGAQIARAVRKTVGLAPNQARAVLAFRDALREGDFSRALRYKLRDKRFDRTLRRLRKAKGELTAEQVERMAAGYERKFRAWNANVNARTAVRDAQRLGKHLATQQAIDAGILTNVWSQWIDSGDGRVRPLHQEADETWTKFGEPFAVTGEVIPGESTFNCFPAGTVVEGDFIAGSKAVYSGPIREIHTARGHTLRVTPNHPILTPDGWRSAGEIVKGSSLFSYRGEVTTRTPADGVNHENGPARIEDVFHAIRADGSSAVRSVSGLDFHGDGRFTASEVDVVAVDGALLDELRAPLVYGRDDGALVLPHSSTSDLEGSGARDHVLGGDLRAPDSGVSSSSLAGYSAGVALDSPPLQSLGFGAASYWHAPVPESTRKDDAGVSGFLRELLHASSGQIAIDDVIEVRNLDPAVVSIHVFDLQSTQGWLLAGNIVCSNCRCIKRDIQKPEAWTPPAPENAL